MYAIVFAQQMPVSGPHDKMKARPLGQKNPEKNDSGGKKRSVWHGGVERKAMVGGMEG